MTGKDDARVALGVIGRPRGVRGAMLFWPYNPASELLLDLEQVFVADVAYDVRDARPLNKGYELSLAGIDSPEAARALTHAVVSVERSALPALDAGEYYLEDLRGLPVYDAHGVARGEVTGFSSTERETFLEVRVGNGHVVLVPARPEFILQVEPRVRVVLQAMEGLFE